MENTKTDKRNKILYILFKSFTYDLLFYYTLETMFLTLVKGFSFSQVFLIASLDLFFVVLLAIPLNFIFKKVSILNRLRIGTLAFIGYLLVFLLTDNIYVLCSFVVLKSIGNLAISVNTTSLLDVIIGSNKDDSSKLEGRATAVWWVLEAVSAVVAGYFFQINPFISYYICIGLLGLALIVTFFFKISKEDNYINPPEKQLKSEKSASSLLSKYKKLVIVIVVLAFAFWGGAEVFGNSAKTFLQDIGTSSVVLGWIYFGAKILTAGANVISHRIETKMGRKFLPVVIGLFLTSVLLMGVIYFVDMPFIAKLVIISLVVFVMYATRNPYRLNIKSTMIYYFDGRDLEKVFSYYFVAENLGGAIFSLIASLTLDKVNLGWVILICFILIFAITVPALVFYVKYQNQMKRDKAKEEQNIEEQSKCEMPEIDMPKVSSQNVDKIE